MFIFFELSLLWIRLSRLQDEQMETNENRERTNNHDGTIAPNHIDFEKIIDLPDAHQLINAESNLPMMVEEIQGYSDEKLVRCNNINLSHA